VIRPIHLTGLDETLAIFHTVDARNERLQRRVNALTEQNNQQRH
jgi:hypothetical protein